MGTSLASSFIVLFVMIFIFLICRQIVCWYWKINLAIELMQQILAELKKTNERAGGR